MLTLKCLLQLTKNQLFVIEMLHIFQKVESIQKMQAGFSLEYQNIHIRYMNMPFSLHKRFYSNEYYPPIPIWVVFELHEILGE